MITITANFRWKVPPTVPTAYVEAVLDNLAARTYEVAREIVPVRTGKLKESIRIYKPAPLVRWVMADIRYSAYVEYGTYKMAARPYLRPAAEEAIAGLGHGNIGVGPTKVTDLESGETRLFR